MIHLVTWMETLDTPTDEAGELAGDLEEELPKEMADDPGPEADGVDVKLTHVQQLSGSALCAVFVVIILP